MADQAPDRERSGENSEASKAPEGAATEQAAPAPQAERPAADAPAQQASETAATVEGVTQPEDQPTDPAVQPGATEASSASEAAPEAAGPEAAAAASTKQAESTTGPSGAEGEAAAPTAGEATAAGDATAPEGGKRKRKRRRKKKGAGAGEAAEGGADAAADAKKKEAATVPFLRFFTGSNAGKKHGFAAGEVVAGRVTSVEGGAIVVDLFGKAVAVADEHEPREIPPEPEPKPEPNPESEQTGPGAAAETPSNQAATAPDVEATPDEGPSLEASTAAPVADAPRTAESPAAQPVPAQATDVAPQPAPEPAPEQVPETQAAAASLDTVAGEAEQGESGEQPEHTGAGEQDAPAAAKGPLTPAPIVPEDVPRPQPVSVGQVFRGRVAAVAESGHLALVNRIVDVADVRAQLEQHRKERRRVEGLVFGFNRGGFDVIVAGIRAFCPASAMVLEEIPDPNAYVGQKLEFLLPASGGSGKDVVVSRRTILERLQRKKAKELLRTLEKGQKFKGRVTSVREFGIFVDIGGIEGLVHQSELSYAHGVKPADVASPGDEVEVQVLKVGGEAKKADKAGDKRGEDKRSKRDRVTRVSLSMKALQPDPWDEHAEAIKEGSVREGKITRTTEFGAFIELAPNIEGLLHISELGRDLKHANQAVKEGETLHVVVERADRKTRRISLSKLTSSEVEDYQAGKLSEGELRSVRPGSRITVQIERVEPRGIVCRVPGVIGKRARGFIPNSESGHERGADLRKLFPVGSEVEVKVVGTDRDGGLRCSPKALAVDEERRAVKDYRREAAKQGFGTFGDLLKAKLDEVSK